MANPFLRGWGFADQMQNTANQRQLGMLGGAINFGNYVRQEGEEPLRQKLLQAQIADLEAKPQDRLNQQLLQREATMARLRQSAQQFDANWQLRYRQAQNNDERLQLDRERAAFTQQLQSEAARLAGAEANYNFGFTPATPPQPTIAAGQPAPQAAATLRASAPSDAEALRMVQAAEASGIPASVTGPTPAAPPAQRTSTYPMPAPTPPPMPTQPTAAPAIPTAPFLAAGPNQPVTPTAVPGKVRDAANLAAQKVTQTQVAKGLEENYARLRDAPQQLANIENAKSLIPASNLFQGSLGEQKLAVTKFFNNNLGTQIDVDGVKSAEELRSRIFFNIMDNLKKMDAQPSQMQQQIMQESLGKLGTDPSALANILDAFGDAIRDKVGNYKKQVEEASKVGIQWPHTIDIPQKSPKAAANQYVEIRTTASGKKLGRKADGTIEEVK